MVVLSLFALVQEAVEKWPAVVSDCKARALWFENLGDQISL